MDARRALAPQRTFKQIGRVAGRMRAPWLVAVLLLLALPTAAGIGLPIGSGAFGSLDCVPACNRQVTTTQGPANEVTIAANPRDPLDLVAAAKDYSLGPIAGATCPLVGQTRVWAGLYDSHDGGRTWHDQLLPRDGALARYAGISDPALAFGPDGMAYYVGLGLVEGEDCPSDAFLETSSDGGASWTFRSVIASGDSDKPAVAVDPATGRIYASWVKVGANAAIAFAWSDDGVQWTYPVDSLPLSTDVPGSMGPAIAAGPPSPACDALPGGGRPVYLVYISTVTTIPSTLMTCDSGATWLPLPPIPATSAGSTSIPVPLRPYRSPPMPAIGVAFAGALAGTVHVAYVDLGQSRGEARVASLPAGAPAWIVTPLELPLDPGAGPFGQPVVADDELPTLAVGPGGDVHVVHYTTRYASCDLLAPAACLHLQGSQLDELLGVVYHHSPDGLVWDPPVRLSTAQSDPMRSHHQTGAVFIGDYIGLAATRDRANAVWTDTRTGRADVVEATVLR